VRDPITGEIVGTRTATPTGPTGLLAAASTLLLDLDEAEALEQVRSTPTGRSALPGRGVWSL